MSMVELLEFLQLVTSGQSIMVSIDCSLTKVLVSKLYPYTTPGASYDYDEVLVHGMARFLVALREGIKHFQTKPTRPTLQQFSPESSVTVLRIHGTGFTMRRSTLYVGWQELVFHKLT